MGKKMLKFTFFSILAISSVLLLFVVGIHSEKQMNSNIKSDEEVIFFNTCAYLDKSKSQWVIPVHGWIFEKENSIFRKAIIRKLLKNYCEIKLDYHDKENFNKIINYFLVDNERHKKILIRICDMNYTLPKSKSNGHFSGNVKISAEKVVKYVKDGILNYYAIDKEGKRTFNGKVRIINTNGISVISDIDDTVKITNVTDKKEMVKNTFFKDFKDARGMAKLYKKWGDVGVQFHFVSSSPWQLYKPLVDFLNQKGFPCATLHLKYVRIKDKTFFNLFKKGTETKPKLIKALLAKYPQRSFILVGDSGEQDPEVYSSILKKYPKQILKIFIRNVTGEISTNNRFQNVFKDISSNKWKLFKNPRESGLSIE